MSDAKCNRREFLQRGLMATAAAGLSASSGWAKDDQIGVDPKKILNYHPDMRYRRLGKTDIYLSVLSLGGLVADEAVFNYAIDHGVNCFHTATGYIGGSSIEILGRVMKTRRDKVFIAVKDNYDDLDRILKVLNTDHLDFIMYNRHSANSVNDPDILTHFEKLHQAGKFRYMGLTTHRDVPACVQTAVAEGKFIIIQPVLNQPEFEVMRATLQTAYEKGISIMGMKTMKGIRGDDMEVAYLKKLLQNPAITTVNKGIGSFEMFDRYLKAVQETLTSAEDFQLYRYAQKNRTNNCMMCSECERACPKGVEISTVLRCKDYYHEQIGDSFTAVQTLTEIPRSSMGDSTCADCRLCEAQCPNGISIVARLSEARRIFEPLLA